MTSNEAQAALDQLYNMVPPAFISMLDNAIFYILEHDYSMAARQIRKLEHDSIDDDAQAIAADLWLYLADNS